MHIIAVVIEVVFAAVGGVVARLREALARCGATRIALSLTVAVLASGCGHAARSGPPGTTSTRRATQLGGNPARSRRASATACSAPRTLPVKMPVTSLEKPANLAPFTGSPATGQGMWRAAGRRV